ncbi:MAG TPA: hypothetical protein VNA68_01620 [Candidatus Dormibacteraeota bacterium]|nr:hypothetical protein [Candidatus Dormibacteraeota bacterium]
MAVRSYNPGVTAYWLVSGDSEKKSRWCEAASRSQAKTVYRNIESLSLGITKTPRGTKVEVDWWMLKLADGNIYWTKNPGESSKAHVYKDD